MRDKIKWKRFYKMIWFVDMDTGWDNWLKATVIKQKCLFLLTKSSFVVKSVMAKLEKVVLCWKCKL